MRSILLTMSLLVMATGAQAGEVDRLYVIDCGWAHALDQSRWSPGINAGAPIDLSDNCYLIHSSEGYLLWDTGITDRLAALPEGQTVPALGQTWHRIQTLVAALAAFGVKPADVRYVAISHWHPDHTGNLDEFPDATVIIQKAEWDYAMALPQKPFSPEHKMQLIDGDKDPFGDSSLTILSTPGHTPAHQSLLVHLQKTCDVALSCDVGHLQSDWHNRRVPDPNYDKAQSPATMAKTAPVPDQ